MKKDKTKGLFSLILGTWMVFLTVSLSFLSIKSQELSDQDADTLEYLDLASCTAGISLKEAGIIPWYFPSNYLSPLWEVLPSTSFDFECFIGLEIERLFGILQKVDPNLSIRKLKFPAHFFW